MLKNTPVLVLPLFDFSLPLPLYSHSICPFEYPNKVTSLHPDQVGHYGILEEERIQITKYTHYNVSKLAGLRFEILLSSQTSATTTTSVSDKLHSLEVLIVIN